MEGGGLVSEFMWGIAGCDFIKFEVNIIFLIKPFLYMTKKLRKIKYKSWESNELLRWNKKHLASFLKCFQLPQIGLGMRVRYDKNNMKNYNKRILKRHQ